MARIDFRALRCQVGIDAVLRLLGFVGKPSPDGQIRGPCPLDGQRRSRGRSFSANLRKNAYRCFHCGSQGNQLDLWAAATRQPLRQAAIDLCEKLHHPVPQLHEEHPTRRNSPSAS